MSVPEAEQENSRLITLMLQVATMDGKLDVMIVSLEERVKKLEDKNKESSGNAVSIIAVAISIVMMFITLGSKLSWT